MRLQETARYAHEHGFRLSLYACFQPLEKFGTDRGSHSDMLLLPYRMSIIGEQNWRKGGLRRASPIISLRNIIFIISNIVAVKSSVYGKKKKGDDGAEDVQTVDGCDVIGTLARCLRAQEDINNAINVQLEYLKKVS